MASQRKGNRLEAEAFLADPDVQRLIADPHHTVELVSKQGEHLFVSTGMEHVFGYTSEEFVAKNGWELTHPDDADVLVDSREGLKYGPVRMVVRGRHKNGNFTWVEIRMNMEGDFISVITAPYQGEEPRKAFWEPAPTEP